MSLLNYFQIAINGERGNASWSFLGAIWKSQH